MADALTARGLTVRYGAQAPLLDGADLEVRVGEIVGLVGQSGCGKSSVLRVLAGLTEPAAGLITAGPDAVPLAEFRTSRPGVLGFISQDPLGSLDPLWSVERLVGESLRAARLPRTTIRAQVHSALTRVELAGIDPRAKPGTLSVGQAQRVSIARALAAEPTLILADEPTSALDPTTAASVAHLLSGIATGGCAVIVASHDLPLLSSLCTRTLMITQGRLVSV